MIEHKRNSLHKAKFCCVINLTHDVTLYMTILLVNEHKFICYDFFHCILW